MVRTWGPSDKQKKPDTERKILKFLSYMQVKPDGLKIYKTKILIVQDQEQKMRGGTEAR